MKFDFVYQLIDQKTSDSLAESYLIFTADGLLELQLLKEINFLVVLCKTYINGTWLLRRKCLSVFDTRSAKKLVSLSLKPLAIIVK